MSTKDMSRRDFLRISALAAAGSTLAACGVATEAPPPPSGGEAATAVAPTTAAPAAEPVTLDVMSLAEYQGPYREIWNVFESENPGIKINVFSINEDTSAAFEAKIAGGYLDHIELTQETQIFFKNDNYEMALNLGEIDFPWWDRFTFDAKNAWSDLFNLPGPRSLDWAQGYVMTWQYNGDLMAEAGLDPRKDVKSMEDLYKWMDEGTAWVKSSGKAEQFWNQAWHNWIFGVNYSECIPAGWSDGTRQRMADCWLGKAKFNAEDSPYRHYYQFFLDAKNKGWIPENMPQRLWEG
ncbi:MAG: substrate-binding domain-containing protein, partial [Anaerolineales bacterium]|nr:substrate-binding domain-containing protein [Anaerolineales bacterium]